MEVAWQQYDDNAPTPVQVCSKIAGRESSDFMQLSSLDEVITLKRQHLSSGDFPQKEATAGIVTCHYGKVTHRSYNIMPQLGVIG